ncbi:MAG: carboxypeptidase regulatory-like domain-containing protein [Acidobacteriota bacterium]|nr:MAG: carboxypeptidase regulatory-like domain-containing protein [Acidobacteriota bacterium]
MKNTPLARRRAFYITLFGCVAMFAAVFVFDLSSNAQRMTKQDDEISAPVPEAGTISGRVFQDFNGNGVYNTSTTITNDGFGNIPVAIDRGVANVQVRAFNASGANVTSGGVVNTDAAGLFTLTTTDAGSGPYRVEFTNLPAGFKPSSRSTDSVNGGTATNSGSTVQFVSTPATNVNLAINYPTEYSQDNPQVAAAVYQSGDNLVSPSGDLVTLLSFPYSAGSTDTSTSATLSLFDEPAAKPLGVLADQIGPTFGLAWSKKSKRLYASAFFKRHVGFGPQGPNAIYIIDPLGSGTVVGHFIVPGPATNLHDTSNYPRDNNNTGWDAVGKSSLGGLVLSEDESTLYVVNLANRTLYALNATTGAMISSQAFPTNPPLPSGNCPAADVRPFALAMYRGQLFAGMVCSAQSSSNVDSFTDSNGNGIHNSGDYYIDTNNNGVRDTGEPYVNINGTAGYQAGEPFTDVDGNGVHNLGDARRLRGYVYSVNPATLAFGSSPLFQMPLNYKRGLNTRSEGSMAAWRPWSAVYRNASTNQFWVSYAQPMLTDIAFDNGDMILAFRDRLGDQIGNGTLSNPSDPSNTNFYQPRTGGDIIRACGSIGSWTLENDARCGGNGTGPQNTQEGPGGGEFYHGDAYTLSASYTSPTTTIAGKGSNHDDVTSGGVLMMPGAPDVITTVFDAIPNVTNQVYDGGIRWLNNTNGGFSKALRLYIGAGNDPNTMGKAGGVGSSMELMTDPAPIEIGNRIWRDLNPNGVQDPGEFGLAGVTVRLYDGSSVVGTAVTDANGEYYFVFSDTADGDLTDHIGQVLGGIKYNHPYEIRLDNPANYAPAQPLFGLLLTAVNVNTQLGDTDSSDSDAISVTNPAGSPSGVFPVISLTTGDLGSNDHTFDIGFTAVPTSANVSVEGRVMLQSGAGLRNAQITLSEANGIRHSVMTGSFGYFRFEGISAGQNVVVTVNSRRFRFDPNSRLLVLSDNLSDVDFIAQE